MRTVMLVGMAALITVASARMISRTADCGVVVQRSHTSLLRPIQAGPDHHRAAPTAVLWRGNDLWLSDPNTTVDRAASVQCYQYQGERKFLSWFEHLVATSGTAQLVNPSSMAYSSLGLWIFDSYSGILYLVDAKPKVPTVKRALKLSCAPEQTIGDLEPAADGGVYAFSGTSGVITIVRGNGTIQQLSSPSLIGSEGMTIRSANGGTSLLAAKPMTGEVAEVSLASESPVLDAAVGTLDGRSSVSSVSATVMYRNINKPVDVASDALGNLLILQGDGRVLLADKDHPKPHLVARLSRALPGRRIDALRIAVSGPGATSRLMAVSDPSNGYVYVRQY
jgi:hypothetical protein